MKSLESREEKMSQNTNSNVKDLERVEGTCANVHEGDKVYSI